MAERYDDSERGRRTGERREENERNDWGRDEPYNRMRGGRGNWEEFNRSEERYGRNDWDRERRGNEFGGRGEWGGREEYSNRGDYGNRDQGSRGEYYGGSGQYDRARGFGGGSGSYTGYGAGGSESYGGGTGMYTNQWQQQGRFSGRGPKGYQRSDDRIREDVCERLTHHPEIDAGEIEVQVKDGEVTLTGTVDDRQTKRLAEDVAERISGVKDVHNQVQVQQRQMAGAHQGRAESGSSEKSGTEKTGTSQKR